MDLVIAGKSTTSNSRDIQQLEGCPSNHGLQLESLPGPDEEHKFVAVRLRPNGTHGIAIPLQSLDALCTKPKLI